VKPPDPAKPAFGSRTRNPIWFFKDEENPIRIPPRSVCLGRVFPFSPISPPPVRDRLAIPPSFFLRAAIQPHRLWRSNVNSVRERFPSSLIRGAKDEGTIACWARGSQRVCLIKWSDAHGARRTTIPAIWFQIQRCAPYRTRCGPRRISPTPGLHRVGCVPPPTNREAAPRQARRHCAARPGSAAAASPPVPGARPRHPSSR
jgi:hypothetical protein